MTWELYRPQWAKHSDGYDVYTEGRGTMAYKDATRELHIEISEVGPPKLYRDTLRDPSGSIVQVADDDPVLTRLQEGVSLMYDGQAVTFQ